MTLSEQFLMEKSIELLGVIDKLRKSLPDDELLTEEQKMLVVKIEGIRCELYIFDREMS